MLIIKIELWSIFEQIVSLFEAFTIIVFLFSVNEIDIHQKHGKKMITLGSFVLWLLNMILTISFHFEGILGISYIIIEFIFTLLISGNKWYKCLFTSVISETVILCVNSLVSSMVVSIYPVPIYSSDKVSRFLVILIVQVLHIYCFKLIIKIHKQKKHSLTVKEWMLVTIMFIMSFLVIALIHIIGLKENISQENKLLFLSAEFIIVSMNLILLYIIEVLSKTNIDIMNAKLESQQRQYVIQYSEDIKQQYEDIRRIRHDMKHTLTAVTALLVDGNSRAAYELISSSADKIDKLDRITDFGNDFVNAVMNSKIQLAGNRNIKVICHATKINTNIDSADLCHLLGNIMDNAIEAADMCLEKKKYIEIAIRQRDTRLDIKISNSIKESVLGGNKELITHKLDNLNHGYGVGSIRAIVKRYSGTLHYFEENGFFVCRIIIFDANN